VHGDNEFDAKQGHQRQGRDVSGILTKTVRQTVFLFKFEDSITSFYRFNTDGTYLGAPETGRKPFQDVSNSNRGQQCQQRGPIWTRVDCAIRFGLCRLAARI